MFGGADDVGTSEEQAAALPSMMMSTLVRLLVRLLLLLLVLLLSLLLALLLAGVGEVRFRGSHHVKIP